MRTPVIHQADQLGLKALAQKRQALIERAQAGNLHLKDLQDSSFTISNLGMYGIDSFNAIINPPQAAILAVGQISEQVIAQNGVPVVAPMLNLTLSCDHRVLAGAHAAAFLRDLAEFIENPLRVLE